ncbi:MAG: DUF4405 domain-containing protein [Anaerolineales bacterium]|nr:DUF4405 domain-containing protein [Anaerolineales bacterium]
MTVGTKRTRAGNPTRNNFWIDIVLLITVLLALAPNFTGLAIHEWLSIAFWAAIVLHLLLHWAWTVNAFKRIVSRLPWATRLNLILNVLLFIDMTVVIFSGLMISREALPLLGLTIEGGRSWEFLHRLTADWSVFLTGLHVALHWRWIVNALKRFVWQPVSGLFRPTAGAPAAVALKSEVKQ